MSMTKMENEPQFYVVQFADELPSEGINKYVCVPTTWVLKRRSCDRIISVKYPKDEHPSRTIDRVKRKEKCNDEWRSYIAFKKYESETYTDAEYWITTKHDVDERASRGAQFDLEKLEYLWHSINKQNNSLQLTIDPNKSHQKPFPRVLIRRPGLQELKKQLNVKRSKLDEGTTVTDDYMGAGCSNKEQSIIIQDVQTKENNIASNVEEYLEQSTQHKHIKQNKQVLSLPIVGIDSPTRNVVNDDENRSQKYKRFNNVNDNCHSHTSSNLMSAEITTSKLPTTPQLNSQHHLLDSVSSSLTFQPVTSDVSSIAYVNNAQRSSNIDASNNKLATSHFLSSSPNKSDQPCSSTNRPGRLRPINKPIQKKTRPKNIKGNVPIVFQNQSNVMNPTETLPTRSVIQQLSIVPQYQSQGVPRKLKIPKRKSINKTAELRAINVNSQEIQHLQRKNVGRSCDETSVDPKVVHKNFVNFASPLQNLSRLLDQHTSFVGPSDNQRNWSVQEKCLQQSYPATNQTSECLPHSYQNLTINQVAFQQEQPRGFNESNDFNHCADSRNLNMTVPSLERNPTNVSSQPNLNNSGVATTFRNITATSHDVFCSEMPLLSHYLSTEIQLKSTQKNPTNSVDQSLETSSMQSAINSLSPSQNPSGGSHYDSSILHRLLKSRFSVQEEYVQQSHLPTNQPNECLQDSYHNQYLPINQDNFQQEQRRRFNENNDFNQSADSIRRNTTNASNNLCQIVELSQQKCIQPYQNNSGAATNLPNITTTTSRDMHCSDMPRRSHYLSPGTQFTSAHENTHRNQNSYQKQLVDQSTGQSSVKIRVQFEDESVRSSAAKYVSKSVDSACHMEECMEEPVSPYYGANLDSNAVSDHETTSDCEMSTDTPVLTEISKTDRLMVEQLEQQMLDQFATLFTQMGSILKFMVDMYNKLRSKMLEMAEVYQKLLDAVESFNMVQNQQVLPTSNVIPEIPQITTERTTEVTS